MKKKQLFINLLASIIAFFVQMFISFILTPILVKQLGEESYGFIGLANNFVTYITIFTIAINSIASRFISVEINKGNIEEAKKYYSSVFVSNLVISIVILILSIFMISKLQNIINIPGYLYRDVKITFLLVVINFIVSLIYVVYQIAAFVKNKVAITSLVGVLANIFKIIVIIYLFLFFKPKIYFIAIAAIIYSVINLIINFFISKKIAPELKISMKNLSFKHIIKLFSSGFWNSINSLSRILLTGLDLLIANLFINPYAMGILSIAKTIPNAIESLLGTIGAAFTPQFIILYSQNKIDELIKEVKFSIKVFSFTMLIPIAGVIVFGTSFYSLWLYDKTQTEISQIQLLSILTLIPYLLSACIFTLPNIDTVTNKLKRPCIFTLIISILTVVTEIMVLNFTNLGIFAIAGVSSIYWVIKVSIFNPINAAKNLNVRWNTFYPTFIKAMVCLGAIIVLFYIININVKINNWLEFFMICGFASIVGYLLNFLLLLNKEDKSKFLKLIKNVIKKSKYN